MNIFALSRNPVEAAQQMLDKHIVKMPTETCQMLHTNILYMQYVQEHGKEPQLKDLKAFHTDNKSNLMKPAMLNHPSTIWARQSYANWNWLYEHGVALCDEYTYRYGKTHGTLQRILDCVPYFNLLPNHNFPSLGLKPITIAMDDKYRIPNQMEVPNWEHVIKSYRHYYLEGKWRFAEWRNERRPKWFPKNWYAVKYNQEIRNFNKRNNANLKLMEE